MHLKKKVPHIRNKSLEKKYYSNVMRDDSKAIEDDGAKKIPKLVGFSFEMKMKRVV